jgi:hypothetical protein
MTTTHRKAAQEARTPTNGPRTQDEPPNPAERHTDAHTHETSRADEWRVLLDWVIRNGSKA